MKSSKRCRFVGIIRSGGSLAIRARIVRITSASPGRSG
jgi:hypothetical protein